MTDDTGTDPQDGKAAADAADDAARDAARDGAGGVAEESENDEDATAAAGEDAKVVVDVAEDEAGAEIIVEGGGGGESERLAEIRDQLLRAMAETENIRNRARREVEDATKYAVANFARDMLAVGDNLARGIESVPEGAAEDDTALTALIEGVAMTQRELLAAFERHGIKSIEPLGEKFDHNFHQAMFEVEDAASEPGTIIKVLQPGYLIAGRLLRPAMVGIAKKPPGDPPDDIEHIDTKF